MGKLVPKLSNRGSGGCPVLAFGINAHAYEEDDLPAPAQVPEA
jgi:hypothetical protein